MVEVYATPALQKYSEFFFTMFFPYLDPKKKEEINSFRHIEDAIRCMAGEWLTRSIISEKLHKNLFEIKIKKDENGKPYIAASSGLHFNMSHSGEWAICAFSAMPVGIDTELMLTIDFEIAKDSFTKNEYTLLTSLPSENEKHDFFYNIWTLKESYLKAVGIGLSKRPNSFEIEMNGNQIHIKGDEADGYNFRQYCHDHRYKISVCSREKLFNPKVFVRIPELTNTL